MKYELDRTYRWQESVRPFKSDDPAPLGDLTLTARVFRLDRGRLWLEVMQAIGFDAPPPMSIIARLTAELDAAGATEIREAA